MCVCVWGGGGGARVCVRARVCVCVCVCSLLQGGGGGGRGGLVFIASVTVGPWFHRLVFGLRLDFCRKPWRFAGGKVFRF